MKVLLINSVCGTGSTGRICTDLAKEFEQNGNEVKIAYGRSAFVPEQHQKYAVRIGSSAGVTLHFLTTRLFDRHGLGSKIATKRFLDWATEYNPDLLWLHNIHGYYINYELLFDWIKSRPDMQVRWTLHDCWAFTGHCAYFSAVGCLQWQTHCQNCPQKRNYPSTFADHCKKNFDRKKAAFTRVRNLTLITPSHWLAGLVKESFLKDYPVEVVHNKIDTTVFRPTTGNFRQKNGLEQKRIVLGVANGWDERKGFSDFIRLADRLDDRYRIVLVGVSEDQQKKLPKNILGILKTDTPTELAEIYTASNIFLNLTYEDNYPTTNLEAQACGTPCITYRTGGSVESVPPENVVEQGDLDAIQKLLEQRIIHS